MQASIEVLGKFDKSIPKDLLDYDTMYEVPEGTPIISTLLTCNTTGASRELAEYLGFDAWDFERHVFAKNVGTRDIDWEVLRETARDTSLDHQANFELDRVVDAAKIFWEKGFIFIYRPNG